MREERGEERRERRDERGEKREERRERREERGERKDERGERREEKRGERKEERGERREEKREEKRERRRERRERRKREEEKEEKGMTPDLRLLSGFARGVSLSLHVRVTCLHSGSWLLSGCFLLGCIVVTIYLRIKNTDISSHLKLPPVSGLHLARVLGGLFDEDHRDPRLPKLPLKGVLNPKPYVGAMWRYLGSVRDAGWWVGFGCTRVRFLALGKFP